MIHQRLGFLKSQTFVISFLILFIGLTITGFTSRSITGDSLKTEVTTGEELYAAIFFGETAYGSKIYPEQNVKRVKLSTEVHEIVKALKLQNPTFMLELRSAIQLNDYFQLSKLLDVGKKATLDILTNQFRANGPRTMLASDRWINPTIVVWITVEVDATLPQHDRVQLIKSGKFAKNKTILMMSEAEKEKLIFKILHV